MVIATLGAIIGTGLSFLVQLIGQIPCDDIVIPEAGPSCRPFSLDFSALLLSAILGIIGAIAIHRLLSLLTPEFE